jgi:hypothetical protein
MPDGCTTNPQPAPGAFRALAAAACAPLPFAACRCSRCVYMYPRQPPAAAPVPSLLHHLASFPGNRRAVDQARAQALRHSPPDPWPSSG